ncbi:hypothetical protein SUGI_0706520 [Cryptomeria japonica]|nr:hypothetical protein SUGI_0706520 [Cryptomeria japonica]
MTTPRNELGANGKEKGDESRNNDKIDVGKVSRLIYVKKLSDEPLEETFRRFRHRKRMQCVCKYLEDFLHVSSHEAANHFMDCFSSP